MTKYLSYIYRIAVCIILSVFIFTLSGCSIDGVRTFVFSIAGRMPIRVEDHGMSPTIQNGDRVIMRKITNELKHNDVILINIPFEDLDNTLIITRIIGLPGDEVSIDLETGYITRNGNLLAHEIIDGHLYEDGHKISEPTFFIVLPKPGVTYSYTNPVIYIVPDNYLFVMGDNRNHSIDSRDERIGFINIDDVIGIVDMNIE